MTIKNTVTMTLKFLLLVEKGINKCYLGCKKLPSTIKIEAFKLNSDN